MQYLAQFSEVSCDWRVQLCDFVTRFVVVSTRLCKIDSMDPLDALLAVALDLTAGLSSADRFDRLLGAVRRAVPCDATALLRLEGDALLPVATQGLVADVRGRRYALADHPRLRAICAAERWVRFPSDCDLADPFDGALAGDASALRHVHACLGCPLRVEGKLVGALTADALRPSAFDDLDERLVDSLGALAGAALRTAELLESLDRALARQGLIARDLMHDAAVARGGELLGQSAAMRKIRNEIEIVASSEFPVLVTGETGVGKELVVRAIHAQSKRRQAPLSYLNCAALSESLAESELFGHTKGAFTGASSERPGKFVVADGATLFLDEVGELPLAIQAKLLRALQEGEIQRVGSDKPLRVDVRVLAATNRDLRDAMRAGRFRADLYHRLAVYPLHVPPLHERVDDIPILAGHFAELSRVRLGTGPVRLSPALVDELKSYRWPGNVRELENAISRLVLLGSARTERDEPLVLTADAFAADGLERKGAVARDRERHAEDSAPVRLGSLRESVDEFQRMMIRAALDKSGQNWAEAARALEVDRANLYHRARRLGMR